MGSNKSKRIGAGEHKARNFIVEEFFKGVDVHYAFVGAGDGDDFVAGDCCAGGIGAVSAVGDEDGGFFVAFVVMIGGHNHYACQFAVAPAIGCIVKPAIPVISRRSISIS